MNGRPETVDWLERYYRLLDSNRVREAMDEFLAENCTFRVGNSAPVGFLDEARRMATLVTGVQHRILNVFEDGEGAVACELEVTYFKRDGTSLTLPGALFATIREGRFVEQRAYVDQEPLRA